jgi:Tol biopolymer transport system component
MRHLLVIALATAATAAVTAVPAGGTTPGRNGAIAYSHFPRLWVVNPDGTGERKLPHLPQSSDDNPDWSPDGSTIAFDRCATRCEVWTIKSDGTGARRLGPNCLRRTDPGCRDRATPAWSPSGKQIAFSGGSGPLRNGTPEFNEVYVMNADGTHAHPITSVTASKPFAMDVQSPMWSPDGKQLVFEVWNLSNADPPNRRALYVVNSDGSGLRQLTDWSLNGGDSPDWSPDGSSILFRTISVSNKHHGNLYTIHPDGTGLKQLTNYPAPKTVLTGSFSPDGNWIVFSRFTSGPYPAIYLMHSDGSGPRRVSRNDAAYEPDWGSAP